MSESSEINLDPVESASGGAVATVETPTKSPEKTDRKPRELPPYKVLLHNDDVNTFEHVVVSILKVVSISPEDALLRTLEAHESGVALLLTTHFERAELYQEQLATFQITSTIEPA